MDKTPTNQNTKEEELDTRILFKRSFTTFTKSSNQHSRTSQATNGTLHLNTTYHDNVYYSKENKAVRDLSVETDACILRRYYKFKRNKIGKGDRSVYSKSSRELEENDTKLSGDSIGNDATVEIRNKFPINVEALMIDNLKELLHQWLQKHLSVNKDTKNKLDTVFDSVIYKLYNNNNSHSTDATYMRNMNQISNHETTINATASITCQYNQLYLDKIDFANHITQKNSHSCTIPYRCKELRTISTLSTPTNLHRKTCYHQQVRNRSITSHRAIKHQNGILSVCLSNEILDTSCLDVLTISTKSLMRRCANGNIVKEKQQQISFPKPFKIAVDSTSTFKRDSAKTTNLSISRLEYMPSLLKSLYATALIDKHDETDNINDNFKVGCTSTIAPSEATLINVSTENNKVNKRQSSNGHPNVEDDVINVDIKFSNLHKTAYRESAKIKPVNTYQKSRRKRRSYRSLFYNDKISAYIKLNSIRHKRLKSLHNKANRSIQQKEKLTEYFKDIFQYFTKYNTDETITIEVEINVVPSNKNEPNEPKTKEAYTDVNQQALDFYCIDGDSDSLYFAKSTVQMPVITNKSSQAYLQSSVLNLDSGLRTQDPGPTLDYSQCTPKIIPLLDGAVSQAQYFFDVSCTEKVKVVTDVSISKDYGIIQEICELRAAIKDLAITTEKLITEQMKKETAKNNAATCISFDTINNYKSDTKCEAMSNLVDRKQINTEAANGPKLKDTCSFIASLAQKSSSYCVIDSESLLKVTDMTPKVENTHKFVNDCLTSIYPKSKSLFEIRTNRNMKLFAYFCDKYECENSLCYNYWNNAVSSSSEGGGNGSNRDILNRQNKSMSMAEFQGNRKKKGLFSRKKKGVSDDKDIVYECCCVDKEKCLPYCIYNKPAKIFKPFKRGRRGRRFYGARSTYRAPTMKPNRSGRVYYTPTPKVTAYCQCRSQKKKRNGKKKDRRVKPSESDNDYVPNSQVSRSKPGKGDYYDFESRTTDRRFTSGKSDYYNYQPKSGIAIDRKGKSDYYDYESKTPVRVVPSRRGSPVRGIPSKSGYYDYEPSSDRKGKPGKGDYYDYDPNYGVSNGRRGKPIKSGYYDYKPRSGVPVDRTTKLGTSDYYDYNPKSVAPAGTKTKPGKGDYYDYEPDYHVSANRKSKPTKAEYYYNSGSKSGAQTSKKCKSGKVDNYYYDSKSEAPTYRKGKPGKGEYYDYETGYAASPDGKKGKPTKATGVPGVRQDKPGRRRLGRGKSGKNDDYGYDPSSGRKGKSGKDDYYDYTSGPPGPANKKKKRKSKTDYEHKSESEYFIDENKNGKKQKVKTTKDKSSRFSCFCFGRELSTSTGTGSDQINWQRDPYNAAAPETTTKSHPIRANSGESTSKSSSPMISQNFRPESSSEGSRGIVTQHSQVTVTKAKKSKYACHGSRSGPCGRCALWFIILWIPIFMLSLLFYGYIFSTIKFHTTAKKKTLRIIQNPVNESEVYINLAELGF